MQNTINTFLGVIAILISLGALYFTFKADSDRSENILLSLNPLRSHDTKITPPFYDKIPPYINTTWELVITNTSDRRTTILENELSIIKESKKNNYTGLNQGIYTFTGKKVDFPIDIDPGTSIKYKVLIGYEITKKSFDYFNKKFDISKNISMKSLKKAMCMRGQDFKDNNIECVIDDKKILAFSIMSSPTRDNMYIFYVKTARDNIFNTLGFWYKDPSAY